MDAIINNLSDLSWWLSIIVSTVTAMLLAKAFNHTPKVIKKLLRNIYARRQRKIKNSRRNQSLVNYEIAKANSYFLVFVMIFCLYSAWLISGSFLAIIKASTLMAMILSFPIYVSEVAWLVSNDYAKELVKARGKIT